jgi:hypothetical protein
VDVETSPPQPDEVSRKLAHALALAEEPSAPDSWWQAGIEEALGAIAE